MFERRAALLSVLAWVSLAGCVQKMAEDGHLRPYAPDPLTPALNRQAPEGTVAQDDPLPVKSPSVTRALLRTGRVQYDTFCAACHGLSGVGDGMIVRRGFLAPPSYHSDRLWKATDQHYFDVITHGFGAMYSYADRVAEPDRWAIVAYIRALQLSQHPDPASSRAASGGSSP